jgi:hypothetical protein
MSQSEPDNYPLEQDDEWLTRVVVDTCLRKFYLYSNYGETRIVDCDDVDQFMNVLELIRAIVSEQYIAYAEPIESVPN